MAENTGKVREFCQSGEVGTLKFYLEQFIFLSFNFNE